MTKTPQSSGSSGHLKSRRVAAVTGTLTVGALAGAGAFVAVLGSTDSSPAQGTDSVALAGQNRTNVVATPSCKATWVPPSAPGTVKPPHTFKGKAPAHPLLPKPGTPLPSASAKAGKDGDDKGREEKGRKESGREDEKGEHKHARHLFTCLPPTPGLPGGSPTFGPTPPPVTVAPTTAPVVVPPKPVVTTVAPKPVVTTVAPKPVVTTKPPVVVVPKPPVTTPPPVTSTGS